MQIRYLSELGANINDLLFATFCVMALSPSKPMHFVLWMCGLAAAACLLILLVSTAARRQKADAADAGAIA